MLQFPENISCFDMYTECSMLFWFSWPFTGIRYTLTMQTDGESPLQTMGTKLVQYETIFVLIHLFNS